MNSDSGRLALFDSACRFKSWRIVEAYKANESQVVFDESAAFQRIAIGCSRDLRARHSTRKPCVAIASAWALMAFLVGLFMPSTRGRMTSVAPLVKHDSSCEEPDPS